LYRKTAREFAFMACREISKKLTLEDKPLPYFITFTDDYQKDSTDNDKMILHFYMIDKDESIVIITDGKYPVSVCRRMAIELAQEGHEEGTLKAEKFIKEYQESKDYDKISKVKAELDEVKEIMTRNIETVIGRGEQLDELVKKSEDLSAKSKSFYKASKKVNGCCTIV
jgi:synaptobrevin family protein YKT6